MSVLPTHADKETTHRQVYIHNDESYDPPTFVNTVLYNCTNRPNANTPTAFTWHLRYGCKCTQVLRNTQQHVIGLHIQHGTLKDLDKLTPCSACLAGKMRKTNRPSSKNFTDITNLVLNNSPLAWSPSTADKIVNPNDTISVDWGIVNKKAKPNVKNVFALFLDTITGNVFSYAAESRGQAGPALLAYIQRFGKPHKLVHDNAQEFIHGEFQEICVQQGIQQVPTPPYDPNKNPVELYMDMLTCCMMTGEDLLGLDFENDGQQWTITEVGFYEEHPVLYYKNKDTGEEEKSSVKEVRQWYNRNHLQQAANSIVPTRKGYINSLAEESYKTIQNYDVKLPSHATKPTSYKKAGSSPFPQWFRAEEKEKQGFLEFTA